MLRDYLDLEKQLGFYMSYHTNPVNQAIHVACIWPIAWTGFALLRLCGPTWQQPFSSWLDLKVASSLPSEYHTVSLATALAMVYMVLYVAMDKKAGVAAAALMLFW
jgi:2-hydroxy fatty acid dioxygenase